MKFGITFNLADTPSDVSDWVALAEERGFVHGMVTDSQMIWRDVYVALTLCAIKTNKMKLGTGVTNPYTRHLTVTANAISSVDELSGGRAFLGIGVGESSVYTLGLKPRPLQELRIAVPLIRSLIRGEEVEYEGKKIRSTWSKRDVPVYIAASGPKSLEQAGEIADGVIIQVGAYAPLIKFALERVKAGLAKSGRSLRNVDVWIRAICYVSKNREEVRREVRTFAATTANTVTRFTRATEKLGHLFSPELKRDMEACMKAYDYYEHEAHGAKHAEVVTDRIIDAFVIAGTPDDCTSKIRNIVKETGLERLSLATYGMTNKPSFIKTFANEVMPNFN